MIEARVMPSSTFSVMGGVIKLIAAHHEEVAGGAFRDVAAFVEQDGLVETVLPASSLASALFT